MSVRRVIGAKKDTYHLDGKMVPCVVCVCVCVCGVADVGVKYVCVVWNIYDVGVAGVGVFPCTLQEG